MGEVECEKREARIERMEAHNERMEARNERMEARNERMEARFEKLISNYKEMEDLVYSTDKIRDIEASAVKMETAIEMKANEEDVMVESGNKKLADKLEQQEREVNSELAPVENPNTVLVSAHTEQRKTSGKSYTTVTYDSLLLSNDAGELDIESGVFTAHIPGVYTVSYSGVGGGGWIGIWHCGFVEESDQWIDSLGPYSHSEVRLLHPGDTVSVRAGVGSTIRDFTFSISQERRKTE